MFKKIQESFIDKENFKFIIIEQQVSQDQINNLNENVEAFRAFFAQMLIQQLPNAVNTAASMQTSYIDNFWLRQTEGHIALLLHMMQMDSDNWFQTEWMLKTIMESRQRRSDENIYVFKGLDNADLDENNCKVNGELVVSLNQDSGLATIFIPLLAD
ncbi:Conserved_hypothetical protein [Hexamita inflata]|uniref:Uncharacterized protein n=1 Tax=Hexamita inflata TaxID=28002 RepID=A0AA86P4N1_9EUKA|nr:Conserved hypothetical protein [Hexamita inflata]